jgi:predicted metal-dependent HD superfamily phosphohydrolase
VNPPGQEQWAELWRNSGAQGDPLPWYGVIVRHYSERHRCYHTLAHIGECFGELHTVRHLAQQPLAIEWAIWFHDVIYDTRASDNEEQSAALAAQCLGEAGLPATLSDSVIPLILATKTHDAGKEQDGPLLLDIDLSILGQDEPKFWKYEAQIREEYGWVPQPVFAAKRAEILTRFLSRPRIYATDWFRDKYEAQARTNLRASIERLEGR